MTTTDNPDRETALRAHIDYLIRDYALENICIDHVQWTQEKVSKFLSENLKPIPLIPKTQLIFPEDPFDKLRKDWDIESFKSCYDPQWSLEDPEQVVNHMKSLIGGQRQRRSERIWMEEDPWDKTFELHRKCVEPIVTKRELLKTPKLGANKKGAVSPNLMKDLPEKVPVASIPSEDDKHDQDEVLNLKLKFDRETRLEIASLVRDAVLGGKGKLGMTVPTPVKAFLYCGSPPPPLHFSASPPLFPRSRRKHTKEERILYTAIEPAKLLKDLPKASIDEEELHLAHAQVVDGWNILNEISPIVDSREPTPNLVPPSSSVWTDMPSTPPERSIILPEKMDEILFPRVPRARTNSHAFTKMKSLGEIAGKLPPLAGMGKDEMNQTLLDTISIIPQASILDDNASVLDGQLETGRFELPEEDLDSMINNICEKYISSTSYNFLLEEKLDENHAYLMPVPRLQNPPFGFGKKGTFSDLHSLVLPEHGSQPANGRVKGFLKKVTGLQSLNLELSWRPFTYGSHIPTHAELCNVSFPVLPREDIEAMSIFTADALRLPSTWPFAHWNRLAKGWHEYETHFIEKWWTEQGEQREPYLHCRRERERMAAGTATSGEDVTKLPSLKRVSSAVSESGSVSRLLDHTFAPKRARQYESPQRIVDSGSLFLSSPDDPTLLSPLDLTTQETSYDPTFASNSKDALHPAASDLGFHSDTFSLELRHGDNLFSSLPPLGSPKAHDLPCLPELNPTSSPCPVPSRQSKLPSATTDSRTALTAVHDCGAITSVISKNKSVDYANPVRDGLANFLRLRGRWISANADSLIGATNTIQSVEFPPAVEAPRVPMAEQPIPEELLRCGELSIGSLLTGSRSTHRYIASLSLIQKRVLTTTLINNYDIQLVERTSLDKPDLVLDPFCSILFFSLAHLPSSIDSLLTDLCRHSWSYARITIVFEAYSSWRSTRLPKPQVEDTEALEPYPFPPPVIKAVRKLRRSLAIYDGDGSKDVGCHISFGFARTVDETAMLVRAVGEQSERRAHEEEGAGAVWDDRSWLTVDEWEDEDLLAAHSGMNIFASISILSRVDLNTFLQMDSLDRLSFSSLIGSHRIGQINSLIESRYKDLPSSSSL